MLFLLPETYNHIVFLFISRIFVPIMRRLLCSFLLFAWMSGISAQTTVKSADVVEKEDSMRVLSIIPVRHPKSLVKQIFKRLKRDMKQRHGSRRYKIEGDFRIDPFPPFSASCIYPVESDNGLEIQEGNRLEEFCYKGVEKLSPGDSAFIRGQLLLYLSFSPVHSSEYYNGGHYPPSPFVFFDETNRWYKIKAFKISYGENSVYRVHLDKKKTHKLGKFKDRETWHNDDSDTIYFDCNTLRIKEFKGSSIREDSIPWKESYFQVEYDEEEGSPVLKQIHHIRRNNHMVRKATAKRIE